MKRGKASTRSTERAGTKIFAKDGSREVPRVATCPLVSMILPVRDTKFCDSGHHTSSHVQDTNLFRYGFACPRQKNLLLGTVPVTPWFCPCDTQLWVTLDITWICLPQTQIYCWYGLACPIHKKPLLGTPQDDTRNASHYTLLRGRTEGDCPWRGKKSVGFSAQKERAVQNDPRFLLKVK